MSARQPSGGGVPAPDGTQDIRNVVLVGPGGSGKSSLFDHILATTNGGYRAPDRSDEQSTSLTVSATTTGDVVLNLFDAPGHPDFVGELRAALRGADAAVFVVSASEGIDATTVSLWHECAGVSMPRAVVVTKLDTPMADYATTLAEIQGAFGEGVMPLGIPQVTGGSLTGVVDLVLGEVHDYSGAERRVEPTGEEHIPVFDAYQGPLIEAIITESEDETLLERYLGGEQVGFDVIEPDLLKAVGRAHFHPVLPVSTDTGAGVDVLLHLVEHGFPSPAARPVPAVTTPEGTPAGPVSADPDGPLVAEVIQTTADVYVGQVSLVRVFSGTLRPDSVVHVSGHMERLLGQEIEGHHDHDEDVRIGTISAPVVGGPKPKPTAIAGDIALIPKLPEAQTSDTISDKDQPLLVEPWSMPEALLPTAITAASRSDEGRLPEALRRLGATDPSLRIEHNAETAQTVLWTMGQMHLDQVLERLREKFNVEVETGEPKIALRETFLSSATAMGRHVKQSGGHGQYAICHITVEPLPRGGGFEFVDKVVGGAVPRQFIPSVEKGVQAQLARGVIDGFPVVDVRVTLFDGKAHSVDSSDAAFQSAGALALKEAAANARTALLEPIDTLTITIADEHVGAVMNDLSSRRGRILGTDAAELAGYTVVHAEVPQTELLRYALDLRSLAHGSGTFTRSLRGYEVQP